MDFLLVIYDLLTNNHKNFAYYLYIQYCSRAPKIVAAAHHLYPSLSQNWVLLERTVTFYVTLYVAIIFSINILFMTFSSTYLLYVFSFTCLYCFSLYPRGQYILASWFMPWFRHKNKYKISKKTENQI